MADRGQGDPDVGTAGAHGVTSVLRRRLTGLGGLAAGLASSPALLAWAATAGPDGDGRRWRRFAQVCAAAVGLGLFGSLALLALIDPYDTGRFTPLTKRGLSYQAPYLASASRGRDPAFDAAVVGNSHVQTLSPTHLDAATGLSFVSLTMPGTTATPQLAVLDWFVRQHPGTARALVIGIDPWWCTGDPRLPLNSPFPFWLYDRSPLVYLTGLLRPKSFTDARARWAYLRGRKQRAPQNGYEDYEAIYEQHLGFDDARAAEVLRQPAGSYAAGHTGPFPAVERLGQALAALPPETAVVLLRSPLYVTGMPAPGTPGRVTSDACIAALRGIADARPRTAVLDWQVDRPEVHVVTNFYDHSHFRAGVARQIETEVAAALRDLLAPTRELRTGHRSGG